MQQPQISRWRQFANSDKLAQAACDFILAAAEHAISARGAFRIVLAGGNTPRDIYRMLNTADADWPAWHIYFGDERCLSTDDPARNSRMARSVWLDRFAIPPTQIHAIPAECGPEAAAARYAQEIAEVGDFDLVLLGLGEDGHTASLFPGGAWEGAKELPDVIAVHDAPKPAPQRVSLSPGRLSRAVHVLYLVSGERKREAVARWRSGAAIPASRICPAGGVDVFDVAED